MSLKLYPHSGWWYADLLANGQRKTFNLRVRVAGVRPVSLRVRGDGAFEVSRAEAVAAERELRRGLEDERHRARLVESLRRVGGSGSMPLADLEKWAEGLLLRQGRSAKHAGESARIVGRFVETLPAGMRADQVSAAMLRKWWGEQKGEARTLNRRRAAVVWVFGQLLADGFVEANPAAGLRAARGQKAAREMFSAEEVEALLAGAGELLRPLILVGVTTALRMGDAKGLRWEDVDLREGWVRVRTGKTGRVVEIPLAARLREGLPGEAGSGPIWPKLAALPVVSLSKRFAKLKRRVGIVGKKDFHSLRVTWITEALSAGVPMDLVRMVTGHASVEVVLRHYLNPKREQMLKAFAALPEHVAGRKNPLRERVVAVVNGLADDRLGEALRLLEGLG